MSGPTADKVFWIEQRYVVPVVAIDAREAEDIAFRQRTDIARECGPVESGPYRGRSVSERDGWHKTEPYGRASGKTVDQWEPWAYSAEPYARKPEPGE